MASDAGTTHSGLDLTPSTSARDEVKVNNSSATDMKHACDDALKRVSRHLPFVQRAMSMLVHRCVMRYAS